MDLGSWFLDGAASSASPRGFEPEDTGAGFATQRLHARAPPVASFRGIRTGRGTDVAASVMHPSMMGSLLARAPLVLLVAALGPVVSQDVRPGKGPGPTASGSSAPPLPPAPVPVSGVSSPAADTVARFY